MKAPLNLFAHASIISIFLTASIFARADEARVKVAVTETFQQTIGPAGEQQSPRRGLQVAQQCQSERDDCMTRPQERCGPGLNGCLSLGQANCKDDTAAPNLSPPTPNTAGIDKALANAMSRHSLLVVGFSPAVIEAQAASPETVFPVAWLTLVGLAMQG